MKFLLQSTLTSQKLKATSESVIMKSVESTMIIDTPKPLQSHVLWLSSKAPLSSGHKAVITDCDDIKPIFARSMKLDKSYNVQIFNRKKEFIDTFSIAYMSSNLINKKVIIKYV